MGVVAENLRYFFFFLLPEFMNECIVDFEEKHTKI